MQVIGDYAFYKCGNLNTVKFAEGSQTSTIGAYAFAYNNNLQKSDITDGASCFTLPTGVTSIGEYCFAYCQNIVIDISKTKLEVMAALLAPRMVMHFMRATTFMSCRHL